MEDFVGRESKQNRVAARASGLVTAARIIGVAGLRACSACAGDYEDPERTAPEEDAAEDDADDGDSASAEGWRARNDFPVRSEHQGGGQPCGGGKQEV